MKALKATATATVAILAVANLAVAQEPSLPSAEPSPGATASPVDVDELTQRCHDVDSLDRQLCLFVARRWLDPDHTDDAGDIPAFELGQVQQRGQTEVTLEKVDWDFKPPRTTRLDAGPCKWAFPCFPARTQSVAVLVRMRCDDLQAGNVHQWKAMDVNGFTYMNALWQKDLTNKSGKLLERGTCEAGRDARFWLTFYVPRDADWLRIVENPKTSQALHWTVTSRRPKLARVDSQAATAALERRCHEVTETASEGNLCLSVVRSYLRADDIAAEPHDLGDPQRRGNAEVTVLDMDWSFKAPKVGRIDAGRCRWISRCLPRENESVAALVRYRCEDSREKLSVHDWQAVDRQGFTYQNALWQKRPSLGTCQPGKSARGWVTFYVPAGTDWLRLVEKPTSVDPLSWTVER